MFNWLKYGEIAHLWGCTRMRDKTGTQAKGQVSISQKLWTNSRLVIHDHIQSKQLPRIPAQTYQSPQSAWILSGEAGQSFIVHYLQVTNPAKLCTPPVAPEMTPQITMQVGRYIDGLPILSRYIFEGTIYVLS